MPRPTVSHVVAASVMAALSPLSAGADSISYPTTRKIEQVDTYHGVKVEDPYRWLEDDNSPETKAWVEAQNKVTFAYLDKLPERDKIKRRLTELWSYERFGLPFKEGGRYFWTRNDGLQAQDVLFTAASLKHEPKVLIDPNTLTKDGTQALAAYRVSPDGKYIAYAISAGGSDWREWRVREIATGKDLNDAVKWSKFSRVTWTRDGKGFFYVRYDAPKEGDSLKGVNAFPKVFYHRLGAAQDADVLVYHRPDNGELGLDTRATDDGKYLLITVWHGTDRKNDLFWLPLAADGGYQPGKAQPLIDGHNAQFFVAGSVGSTVYIRTNDAAPRGRVIAVDIANPAKSAWKEIVPESREAMDTDQSVGSLITEAVNLVNNQLVVSYLKDARNAVRVYSLDGKLVREVKLPGLGSVKGFLGDANDAETFFLYADFASPSSSYRLDLKTGDITLVKRPKVAFDPNQFEVNQKFFTSRDGTRVPMFIVHKKGLKLDGSNPVWLYGYGGFNVSMTPSFSASRMPWLELGGVYVLVNLRGGGEYGKTWHEAAIKAKRQNAFDDFIGAAEWLIANKYTSKGKLAINGGSNGGLLVGAVMNQRPELFGAAVPEVGVMDMLRYHKFTIGWAWASDYGSAENAEEFKTLFAYSPLHNLKQGVKYPPTLVMTADHDDRVVPAHSFKYAAQLQSTISAQKDAAPALIRIGTKAGHGAGKPVQKVIEERADVLAFMFSALGGAGKL
jgi:prolyl oligopeptidase